MDLVDYGYLDLDVGSRFSPKSSWRLPTILNILNISFTTKVAQSKTIAHINYLGKTIVVAHANFLLEN